jgi:hypothetical protein
MEESRKVPPKGLAISWVGHSFHAFLPRPVEMLAKEAGIKDHRTLGNNVIGTEFLHIYFFLNEWLNHHRLFNTLPALEPGWWR